MISPYMIFSKLIYIYSYTLVYIGLRLSRQQLMNDCQLNAEQYFPSKVDQLTLRFRHRSAKSDMIVTQVTARPVGVRKVHF
jgi:predicted kinase